MDSRTECWDNFMCLKCNNGDLPSFDYFSINDFSKAVSEIRSKSEDIEIECILIGGSRLYGLNNKDSDIDIRGVFGLTDPKKIMGLDICGSRSFESIVINGEFDYCLYEVRRFFELLKKTNTQVIEILFAPEHSFICNSEFFNSVRKEKYKLINPSYLLNSLKGYIHGELRLTTGDRTGKLGSKRKEALEKYGYSYKNLVQVLRLHYCSVKFFTTGEFPVDMSSEDIFEELVDIKTNPQNYNLDFVIKRTSGLIQSLDKFSNHSLPYSFDEDIANEFIISRYKNLICGDKHIN